MNSWAKYRCMYFIVSVQLVEKTMNFRLIFAIKNIWMTVRPIQQWWISPQVLKAIHVKWPIPEEYTLTWRLICCQDKIVPLAGNRYKRVDRVGFHSTSVRGNYRLLMFFDLEKSGALNHKICMFEWHVFNRNEMRSTCSWKGQYWLPPLIRRNR